MQTNPHLIALCLLLMSLAGCQSSQSPPVYTVAKHVGDIAYKPDIDKPGFTPCNPHYTFQYDRGELFYEGEGAAIKSYVYEHYQPVSASLEEEVLQSGYITIRFIINCKGQTGRFRMKQMNQAYGAATFSADITTQLLAITRSLDVWKPLMVKERAVDGYHHITFRLQEGKIIDIIP